MAIETTLQQSSIETTLSTVDGVTTTTTSSIVEVTLTNGQIVITESRGPKGDKGDDGAQGPQGPQGPAGPSGASTWGSITGTLSDQSDLNAALIAYGSSAQWGAIAGSLSDQTDLQTELDGKINATQADALNGFVAIDQYGNMNASFIPNDALTIAQTNGLQTALDGKEASIGAGTTSQYWRGDKSWQTLDKSSVGLANVDNTSDANKPISSATQTALNAKQPLDATLTALAALSWSAGTQVLTLTGADTLTLKTVGQAAGNLLDKAAGDALYQPVGSYAPASGSANYQAADADLTSIAALAGTTGFLRKTAANTWSLDTATYLTANQTITLSGDISGSGSTAITTAIGANKVTRAMLSATAGAALLGATGAGNVADLTGTQATTLLDVATTSLKGLLSAADKTKLDGIATGATANTGTVTSVSVTTANGVSGSVATNTTTPAISLTLGAITPSSVAATGTVTGSNLSGSHSGTSSGTNTGDQTITLTGDVTGSGTGSFAATIGAGAVTLAKQAALAANSIIGNNTGASATPIALSTAQTTAMLNSVVGDSGAGGTKGLVPAPAAGDAAANKFLKADGTWATTPAGGGGSPGGATTQIQFNDAGTFGGDADLTWNSTTNTLTLGGTDTNIVMKGITTEPAAPATGNLMWYSKSIAGRMVPKIKGPSGLDYGLQASLWQNNIVFWTPTTATGGLWIGTTSASAGTYTTALPTTTNVYTATKRGRYANVATTTNQVLGQRTSENMFFRGNAAGQGGFFFFARCGMDVWTNGGRFFAGFCTATTVVSAEPSAFNNTVGFAVDAADNGAISFLTRGTAATKASTGFTLATNKGYDLFIFAAPNSSEISWRIIDITTGTEASGTATANLPTNTTLLSAGVLASNAALTPVTSIQLGVNRIYVETDY